MNNLLIRLRNCFQPEKVELEVDEELRFHVDLLLHEYMKQGMSPEEARAATVKRFGSLDQFKTECIAICRRTRPLQRAFKRFLILLALTGLIVRINNSDFHVARIGDMLIMIAIACRLLIYVRNLTPSRFRRRNESSSSIFS
ncbi:MAG TPA: permease prefix domain 1-containing protein [Pyrinomonadaceae bacterium]|nr:permease prefix domain 1-containing protein [Pyrinomonadaceae bacterium]